MAAGLIALAALAVYHNSFSGPLVFDDVPSIGANPTIRHLWPLGDALSPPADLGVRGRPVLNLSFALSYALSGEAVWGYHAVNLLIHILAGLALFGIARRTLGKAGTGGPPVRSEPKGHTEVTDGRAARPYPTTMLAFAIALLWTLHPLQTGSVTYLSQRAESLMGLFYLLTLYCFIRSSADSDNRVPRRLWAVLSIGACLLGMATKEVMVTAPVIVLLYDRTFLAGTFREAWRRRGWLHGSLCGTWILLYFLMAGLPSRGIGEGWGIAWWAYALKEGEAIVHYLQLAVWPHPLVLDYGPDCSVSARAAIPCFLLLLSLLAGTAIALRRRPVLGFVGCWFFLILAPTSSVVPVVFQPMAENRMYLPLAAVVALAVAGLAAVFRRRQIPRPRLFIPFAAIAFIFGLLTLQRNQAYGSAIGLWRDTVQAAPDNPRAHYNLATLLLVDGSVPAATEQFREALRLRPNYPEACYNLGIALADSGHLPEAIAQYEEALRLRPRYPEVENNLGIALVRSDRRPDAIRHFEAAVRLQPDFAEAQASLGMLLFQLGTLSESVAHFQKAVRLRPEVVALRNQLALALAESGRLPEAVAQFEEALRLKPDSVQTRINLGSALANENRFEEAAAQYEEALRLDPSSAAAHYRLGLALRALGREPEAQSEFDEAERLKGSQPN